MMNKDLLSGLDVYQRFKQALEHISEYHADARRLIITGDLTHSAEEQAYKELRELLSTLRIPVRLLIGNHDTRETFFEVFEDHPRDSNGFVNYAEDVDDERLIYLDTVAQGQSVGMFCEKRCQWLSDELERCSRARLFLHHQPFEVGIPSLDTIAMISPDRQSFRAVIERFKDRVAYMHFGHIHTPVHGTFCGIPFASALPVAHQSIPEFSQSDYMQFAAMEPAYTVMDVADRNTMLYQIPYMWSGQIDRYPTS